MYSKCEENEWMSSSTSLSGIGYYSLKKLKNPVKQDLTRRHKSWSQDDLTKMSEGRKAVIHLLDDRRLEITVQPKLLAGELLDMVASHFSLKEKDYFGLAYHDETQHQHWLQLDRRVLEHDFPKKSGSLSLLFAVRFFIESVLYLRENVTIELFFLQAKHSIHKGNLDCDPEVVFELGAYLLQTHCGDFKDEESTRKYLKKLSVLPTSVLKEHPSISFCESRIISYYCQLTGLSRGSAIVRYMNLVESLPTYGIHYYEVKDKSGLPWWLGLSYKGISLFDYTDKRKPRKVFAWKQLENLYFRDKKFSIEVHDLKRVVHAVSSSTLYQDALREASDEYDDLSDAIADPTTQVSVSRRTFGPGNVNVHAWFAATQNLTKCIWSMAVSQHQFYLDRKQSKSQLGPARSLKEIAEDLSHSTASLVSSEEDQVRRSESVGSLSLHSSRTELTPEALEAATKAKNDMAEALKSKKASLQELLNKKEEELKALCLQEYQLTGQLPPEWPADEPKPKKTEFAISLNVINRPAGNTVDKLSQIELDHAIQKQITEAALRLAKDTTVAKSVRRKRKQAYQKANTKLKEMERQLNEHRLMSGKAPIHRECYSADELSEDSREFLDSDNEILSPVGSHSAHHPLGLPRNKSASQLRTHNVRNDLDHLTNNLSDLRIRPSTPSSHSQGSSSQRSASPSSMHHHPYSHGMSTPSPNPHRRNMVINNPPLPRPPNRTTTMPNMTGNTTVPNMAGHGMQYSHQQVPPYQAYTLPPPSANPDPNNLYNLSKQQVYRYDSRDELEVDTSQQGMTRTTSFESSSSSSGGYPQYPQQKPPPHPQHNTLPPYPYAAHVRYEDSDDQMSLPELEPSKFGSKRESHSDKRDSPYYQAGLDPSSQSVYGGSYHHSQRLVRQQAPPPSTPTFSGPPSASVEYTSSERPPIQPRHPANSIAQAQSNFVEYSKPFETADVARYSEKRRHKDHRHHHHHTHSSGKPPVPKPGEQHRILPNQSPQLLHRAYPQLHTGNPLPAHMGQLQQQSRSRSSSPLPNDAQYPASQHVPSNLTVTPSSSYSSGYSSGYTLPHGQGETPYSNSSSVRSLHSTPHQSLTSIKEDSFNISNPSSPQSIGGLNDSSAVSRGFSQEMLQWYDNREQNIHSPIHSSTLV